MYWGCGASVRTGQPKVLDFASMTPQDAARFFTARSALRRGAHAQPGRPIWPNPQDARMLPANASLVGEHRYAGAGVPDGFAFQLPASVDLMPPLNLQQHDAGGATELQWSAAPTARAYFVSAMGAAGKDQMVLWTSSEVAETGFGLIDYQAPSAIDGWLREKVLLPASTTRCTIPKGVFPQGTGGMVRMIGYGPQLNLVHPPRPSDPNARWEPLWAVQVRTKSTDGVVLGMPSMHGESDAGGQAAEAPPPAEQPKRPSAVDVLKGILGR